MRRISVMGVILMSMVVVGCAPVPVEKNPYDGAVAELTALIEAETARLNVPSLSIALVDGQHIVWQRGFGVQNAAAEIPASENTVYRVGSISKVVTATVVAQAAERGLLDLDAPITNYLPELVFEDPFDSEQRITLRHLHAHRAGILRESPVGNYFDSSQPTIEATVDSIIGSRLIHAVGSTTKYSNLGPTVAGLVLERVTGVPFASYVQQQILDPIGMTSSSFLRDRDIIRTNLADAFMIGFDSCYFSAPVFELGTLAAGNLYSTVGDLARFIMMFFDQGMAGGTRVLAPETVRDMMRPQFPDDSSGQRYGIGFRVGDLEGRTMVSHAGAVYGFASLFMALPEEKLAVVVLNDVDLANGLDDKIASQALRLMLDAKLGADLDLEPEPVAAPPLDPTAYTGKYLSGARPAFVTVEKGLLRLQLDGITRIIRPLADGSFMSDDRIAYGGSIRFALGDEGQVKGFVAGGREYSKVEPYTPDTTVPPRWRQLVGDYGWPYDVMRISVLDGSLWCRVEWAFSYPMTEVSGGAFAFPDYGLYSGERLVFQRATDGSVAAADMASVMFPRIASR